MHELEALSEGQLFHFRDWPDPNIPLVAAGVYTVWDTDRFVYAGMAGHRLTHEAIVNGRTGNQ